MKNIIHLLLNIVLLLPVSAFALDPELTLLVEKRKNITKVFEVNERDQLVIDNQYGEVKVNLWKRNEIKVEIIVTSSAPSDAKATEYINAVTIGESRAKNLIELKTIIDKKTIKNNQHLEKNDKDYHCFEEKIAFAKMTKKLVPRRKHIC